MEAKRTPGVVRNMEGLLQELLEGYALHEAGTDRWRSMCPFCSNGQGNTEVFITWRNGTYKCFRCQASGSPVDLVRKVKNMSFSAARELVALAPRYVPPIVGSMKLKEKGPGYPILPESEIAAYRGSCPSYLLGRGFKQQTLREYHVGYDHHQVRIVIPARDYAARLVGITYRLDFDEPGKPKYWHDNWKSSEHLYGFHLYRDVPVDALYLVEGQLDAQRMRQIGLAAVAVLGAVLHPTQVNLLHQYAQTDTLILAGDNDEAGHFLRDNAIRALTRTRFMQKLRVASYPGHDPGELHHRSQITSYPWYARLLSPK